MKFSIEIVSKNSGRTGILSFKDKPGFSLKTPAIMLTTKGGSLPYISKEVFDLTISPEEQKRQLLSVNLQTTLEMKNSLVHFKKGISKFVGLDIPAIVHLSDPSISSVHQHHEANGVAVFTKGGKSVISAKEFNSVIEAFNPEGVILLSDSLTDISSGKNRCLKSVQKTREYVEECIKIKDLRKDIFIFSPVVGGFNKRNREDFLKFIKTEEKIDGYSIEGLHKNGSSAMTIPNTDLFEIVDLCQEHLPKEKPKIMLGAYMPLDIVDLVNRGIDVFDNSLAFLFAEARRALVFNVCDDPDKNRPGLSIDVTAAELKETFEPILENCSCLACQKYSLAYIRHLFDSRELLGHILLTIHNFHHYDKFFESIRQHVETDTLSILREIIAVQSRGENVETICKSLEKNEEKSIGLKLEKE